MDQSFDAPHTNVAGTLPLDNSINGTDVTTGVSVKDLFQIINDAGAAARLEINMFKLGPTINIGDMFEMQLLMNHLSQLSEMSTSVVSASNLAISSMARTVKG